MTPQAEKRIQVYGAALENLYRAWNTGDNRLLLLMTEKVVLDVSAPPVSIMKLKIDLGNLERKAVWVVRTPVQLGKTLRVHSVLERFTIPAPQPTWDKIQWGDAPWKITWVCLRRNTVTIPIQSLDINGMIPGPPDDYDNVTHCLEYAIRNIFHVMAIRYALKTLNPNGVPEILLQKFDKCCWTYGSWDGFADYE